MPSNIAPHLLFKHEERMQVDFRCNYFGGSHCLFFFWHKLKNTMHYCALVSFGRTKKNTEMIIRAQRIGCVFLAK